jgi:hypothetical protein
VEAEIRRSVDRSGCCPRLRSREHGSWYFSADLPSAAGERHRVRRGGFGTEDVALAALEALASPTAGDVQAMFIAALWDSLAAAGGGHEMNDVGAGHEDVLPAKPIRCVEL